MPEVAAVNASPLIFLAAGDCFDILCLAGTSIVVPAVVADEIRRRGPDDVTARAIDRFPWLTIVPDSPVPDAILSWDLGAGESAVLAWAIAHRPSAVIIDDLAARRCALAFGIPLRGTLGLVLLAKQRGVIVAARPVLERLVRSGMYLSARALNAALALVGE